MYPYCYPGYFASPQMGTPQYKMPVQPQMPSAPLQPQMPSAPLPQTYPEIPGTTSGKPVIPAPPPTPIKGTPAAGGEVGQGFPVVTDTAYTQGFLKTQIGQKVRIEFLIGTNLLTDRTGVLVDVGISYVVIRLQETDDLMMGDIYSIKFVTFFK